MANTKITTNVIADNAVGITQLNVSDGSSGQFLKTDGSGTLSFATVTGTTINNNADNRVITGSGTANTLEGESKFTFDGSSLVVEPTTATGLTYAVDGTNSFINLEANSVAASVQLYAGQSSGGYFSIGAKDSGGTLAERMRVTSTGTGIGTGSPARQLHVNSGSTNVVARFESTDNIGAIELKDNGGSAEIGCNNNDLVFFPAGAEKARLTSTGRLGIGVTSPTTNLHMNGTGDMIRLESTNSGAGGAQIDMLHFSSSPADGDTQAAINMGGYYSGSSSAYFGAIRCIATDVGARHGRIEFLTRDDSSFTTAMTISHESNVNIGTTAAATGSHKLVVESASTTGTVNSHIALIGDSATNGQGPQILFSESGDGQSYAGGTIGFTRTGGNSQGDLLFGTRGISGDANTITTERMRILNSGEVHITSAGAPITPTVKHSGATGDVSKLRLINRSGQSSNKGGLLELGAVTNDGVDRSDVFVSIAGLKQNATSGDMQGYLQIALNNGSALDEVIRVTPAGTMHVNTDIGAHTNVTSFAHSTYNHAAVFGRNSTPDGTVVIEDYDVSSGIGNTVLKLYLRDQDPATHAVFIDFSDGGGRVGSVTHNDDGGGVTYNTTSDYRLKENVNYTWDALALLNQLKPAKFNFIGKTDKTRQGFLAHEVMDIVPGSVRGTKDQIEPVGTVTDFEGNTVMENVYEHFCKEGQTWTQTGTKPFYQQLDYARLVPLLTKAIQEQQTIIDDLKSRIETLEG